MILVRELTFNNMYMTIDRCVKIWFFILGYQMCIQICRATRAYVGCFTDNEYRLYDFPNPIWSPTDQTIDKCMRFCKRRNFIYSGLEYKTQCFCGSVDPRRISGYSLRSESECNMPCGGQSRERCGGEWRLSIHKDCSVLQPYPPYCAEIDCTTSSNKWCVRCTDSLYYKLIGHTCIDKCSSKNRWCWPGSCGNEVASNCNCINGFKTVKNELTANCQPIIKPTIDHCQISAVAKDGTLSSSKSGSVQCIKQKDFYGRFQVDHFKINFMASFKIPKVTISRPNFISRELFGITDVEISMQKITVSGNQKDLGTTRYKFDSLSKYPEPIYENDTAAIFVQESLKNGERICVTFRVQAGGYFVSKEPRTHAERQVRYDKTETYHTLCYIYDDIPPKHCAEANSCRSEPLILARRLSSSRNITIHFKGWIDPNINIGSGIESYEIAVYEVEHLSSAIQNRDNKVIHILNIYPSDNKTSVNIELPLKTPMLYAVLLTVKDKANNMRRARRFVLYDNSSVIDVSSDHSCNITEFMHHNNSSQLCISWTKRFHNNKFKFNNFLDPIRPDTAIKGIYDQEVGLLPINGTKNVNGLTAFYFTFMRNNENVYTGKLKEISHQSVCLTSEIKDGDIITFHLKVEDIMNHTLNDSVTVYIKHITVTPTKETSHDYIIGGVTGGILSVVIVLLLGIVIVQHKRLTEKKLTATDRSRKIIGRILVFLVFLYLLGSRIPSIGRKSAPVDETASLCIDDNLRFLKSEVKKYDAFINHYPLKAGEQFYPAYVGNGKVSVSLDSEKGMYIRLNRALSLPVKYYPIVAAHLDDYSSKDATVLNIHHGIAEKIQCFEVDKGWRSNCLTVESLVYASRTRPSILVQDIKIRNPSKNSVVVNLDQIGQTQLKDAKVSKASTTDATGMSVEYTSTQGVILIPDLKYKVHIAIATVKIGPSVAIKAGKSVRFHVVTAVNYTQAVDLKSKAPEHLQRSVDQLLESVMKIDYASLREEHIKVWRDIWKSGFGISNSKAAGSLNGDKINTTIYYVLSNIQAPLHELSTTVEEKSKIQKTLHYPDRCYGGHTLLFYSETLWSEIKDEEDIADVTSTWMITLEKKGCNIIVRAGAEGVLQAILLSLGGLRFDDNHLEMSMEPKDLHRDLLFHRLNYGNNTHVNISVIVDLDNKAVIRVSLDRNDRPYYACDAGCIDAPIALSKEVVQFPVKRTEPLTSILYITADKQHMEELKHTIHVKEIKEAPAHEHHVIALHKHGHHFGGLPTIFWASLAFLIIIFHLFLFKLIYNEYCQGQDRYGRTRYSV